MEIISENGELINKSKLRWQCRRGMLELDLLLGLFLEQDFDHLPHSEQAIFIHLLTYPDQTLYRWLLEPMLCENLNERKILQKINAHKCSPLSSI